MTTINAVGNGLSGATGTGNFVGANSPALITPALGTPVSGNLSNCLDYPVTMVNKQGSGGGNYTTTSGTATNVDGTNLSYTVTIPLGYKLHIVATGTIATVGAATNSTAEVFLTDTSTSTILSQIQETIVGATGANSFAVNGVITGDGNSHTITLQFASSGGVQTIQMYNFAANCTNMTFLMMPSS